MNGAMGPDADVDDERRVGGIGEAERVGRAIEGFEAMAGFGGSAEGPMGRGGTRGAIAVGGADGKQDIRAAGERPVQVLEINLPEIVPYRQFHVAVG